MEETAFDRNYIVARETLLDAVEALGPYRDAAILVGAQAIYAPMELVKMTASPSLSSPMTQTSLSIPTCWKTAPRSTMQWATQGCIGETAGHRLT